MRRRELREKMIYVKQWRRKTEVIDNEQKEMGGEDILLIL